MLAALASLQLGCASKPPDVPFAVEINPTWGHVFYTISDTEFDIDDQHPYLGHTWPYWRAQMMMFFPDSYMKIKLYILNTCHSNHTCDQYIGDIQKKILSKESLMEKAIR